MSRTLYSIVRDGINVFDNSTNQACYATIFGFGSGNLFETYIKPNTFFELYIPLSEFHGGFKKKKDAEKFLNSIRKMGFVFESNFQTMLPRNLESGWRISFDVNKSSKIEIKIATYLIRFMWECLPAGFDSYYFKILAKYGKSISHFSLFKYAYYNFGYFESSKYYSGHALSKAYFRRDYQNNLKDKLKEDFYSVYSNLFSPNIAGLIAGLRYPMSLQLTDNPHFPKSLQDSIDNLTKYLNNPQKELDK